jgi:hypothetical protein
MDFDLCSGEGHLRVTIFFSREGEHGPMTRDGRRTGNPKGERLGWKEKTKREAPESEGPMRLPSVETVRKIRKAVEIKLQNEVGKASLADYIKLLQLEKEMTEQRPVEIRARWIDPEETDISAPET